MVDAGSTAKDIVISRIPPPPLPPWVIKQKQFYISVRIEVWSIVEKNTAHNLSLVRWVRWVEIIILGHKSCSTPFHCVDSPWQISINLTNFQYILRFLAVFLSIYHN